MTKTQIYRYLSLTASAAGLALIGLLTVTLLNQGVTQQQFEIVTGVEAYARDLQTAEGPFHLALLRDLA